MDETQSLICVLKKSNEHHTKHRLLYPVEFRGKTQALVLNYGIVNFLVDDQLVLAQPHPNNPSVAFILLSPFDFRPLSPPTCTPKEGLVLNPKPTNTPEGWAVEILGGIVKDEIHYDGQGPVRTSNELLKRAVEILAEIPEACYEEVLARARVERFNKKMAERVKAVKHEVKTPSAGGGFVIKN